MEEYKINCVIVKDLSRLGRNYIEVGKYIEQIFPMYNVRFIAINDNIDSFNNPSSINTILVPFKNLINDEYARDTSIKIRSSLNSKKKNGEFIGAFTAYGYIKDPTDKHKLLVDKDAAKIVRKIFYLKVNEGFSNREICRELNNLGILNPTGYKRKVLKQNYKNSRIYEDDYSWTTSTIRKILKNEVYIGNTIQGKRRVKSYKIHKVENVPKEEWIRVENTHEPIIEKTIYEKAQDQMNKRLKVENEEHKLSIWAGILKCADCKKTMTKKSSTNKSGKKYEYYICSTYKNKSNKLCTMHSINVEKLEKDVLKQLNHELKINDVLNKKISNVFLNEIDAIKKEKRIDNYINQKQKEIIKRKGFINHLYEDWKNDDITKDEYVEYKNKYKNEIDTIEKEIKKIEDEKKKIEEELYEENNKRDKFEKNNKIDSISRRLIIELIDCIYVQENGSIIIKYREN